jgi:hypothetical protein
MKEDERSSIHVSITVENDVHQGNVLLLLYSNWKRVKLNTHNVAHDGSTPV